MTPLSAGDRVFHAAQIWARSLKGGTAVILEVQGPDRLGEYEYLVRTGEDFSRRTGPDNPEVRKTRWASYNTMKAR